MGLDHLFSISSFYFTEGGASLKCKVRTAMVSCHFFFFTFFYLVDCVKRGTSLIQEQNSLMSPSQGDPLLNWQYL